MVPMGARKTRALGGPEPPLASSTLVQPIINKACLDPNALYPDIPASAPDSGLASDGAHIFVFHSLSVISLPSTFD